MYGYKKGVDSLFDDTVRRPVDQLKSEGFGVLTEIDVQATLKTKLNLDFDKYVILGACNPPFAYQSLQTERDIGLLLPCNVIVYEQGGKSYVSAILPTVAMSMVQNEDLRTIAEQVEAKLKKVIDNI
jgi:uncharacterized protein (DUF302 family)